MESLGICLSLKIEDENYKILEDILKGEEITARITSQFNLEEDLMMKILNHFYFI